MSMPHESLKSSAFESQQSPAVKFSRIDSKHIAQIVRQGDAPLFRAYFADALHAGFAKDCDVDRLRMAALFHQVHRVGEARVPGSVIYKTWKNRDQPGEGGLRLADLDEEFARKLLRPRASPDRPMFVSPIRVPDDCELTPDQIREQRTRGESNRVALATMERLKLPT